MRWWRNGAYDALVVFYSAYNHAISLEGDVTLQKQYVIINWDTVNVLFSPSHSTGHLASALALRFPRQTLSPLHRCCYRFISPP